MGISGAMRRDELTKMSIDDIKDEHSVLIVAVIDTKSGIKRTFTVTNPEFVRLGIPQICSSCSVYSSRVKKILQIVQCRI
jgi:hypothetical protein